MVIHTLKQGLNNKVCSLWCKLLDQWNGVEKERSEEHTRHDRPDHVPKSISEGHLGMQLFEDGGNALIYKKRSSLIAFNNTL